jgi:predicted NodU family carbamoyl transferase
LNTSFNDREPIVETPEHAINCFLGTNIDYLYFPEYGILCNKREK